MEIVQMDIMTIGNPFYLNGEIVERKKVGSLYHRLRIALPQPVGPIKPGQFAMLKIEDGKGIILSRPFSIHNFEEGETSSWLDFLFKVVGKGTDLLARLSVRSHITVLAPLGNGFPDPPPGSKALLIAGGMGIAPLFPLAKRLKALSPHIYLLYGAKSQKDLIFLPEIINVKEIEIMIVTEDGTAGKQGMVTELLRNENGIKRSQIAIYACGPELMLQSIANYAAEHRTPCYVSLERWMACGLGACLSCVVDTVGGYKRVCSEGPVFEAQEILWGNDAKP